MDIFTNICMVTMYGHSPSTLCNPRKVCNDVRKRLSFLQIRKINSRVTLAFYTWDATCNPFRPHLETDYHVLIELCWKRKHKIPVFWQIGFWVSGIYIYTSSTINNTCTFTVMWIETFITSYRNIWSNRNSIQIRVKQNYHEHFIKSLLFLFFQLHLTFDKGWF